MPDSAKKEFFESIHDGTSSRSPKLGFSSGIPCAVHHHPQQAKEDNRKRPHLSPGLLVASREALKQLRLVAPLPPCSRLLERVLVHVSCCSETQGYQVVQQIVAHPSAASIPRLPIVSLIAYTESIPPATQMYSPFAISPLLDHSKHPRMHLKVHFQSAINEWLSPIELHFVLYCRPPFSMIEPFKPTPIILLALL